MLLYGQLHWNIFVAHMEKNQLLHALPLLIILAFLIYAFFVRTQAHRVQALKTMLIWTGIFSVLIIIYAFRFELITLKNRVLAVLIPSYSWSSQEGQITVARHENGHFYLYAKASNNNQIKFLVDTGATNIALTMQDAIKLGIDVGALRYTHRYSTANGMNYGAPVQIPQMTIGKKTFYNVRAHVMRSGLDISLLGMSLIDDFKDFQITRDLLILNY